MQKIINKFYFHFRLVREDIVHFYRLNKQIFFM